MKNIGISVSYLLVNIWTILYVTCNYIIYTINRKFFGLALLQYFVTFNHFLPFFVFESIFYIRITLFMHTYMKIINLQIFISYFYNVIAIQFLKCDKKNTLFR